MVFWAFLCLFALAFYTLKCKLYVFAVQRDRFICSQDKAWNSGRAETQACSWSSKKGTVCWTRICQWKFKCWVKETCEIWSIWQRSFAKHLLQLSSEEQILFGTPKYSEFHRTAPLEETGGKAWVLFYNMHTVSDLRLIYIVIWRLLSF